MKQNKKWIALFLFIYVLSISVISSFSLSAQNFINALENKAQEKYGAQSIILKNTSDIKAINNADLIGSFDVTSTFKEKNGEINFGWFDKNGWDIAHLKVIKGTFPTKQKEVLIESSYLKLFKPTLQVGDYISIDNRNYKIKGIVDDYSALWTPNSEIKYPNIFTIKKNNSANNIEGNSLVFFKNDSMEKSINLSNTYGETNFLNENYYNKGLVQVERLNNVSDFFSLILFICIGISLINIYNLFHRKQLFTLGILRSQGFNIKQISLFKILQGVSLIIVGSIMSYPISYLINLILCKVLYSNLEIKVKLFSLESTKSIILLILIFVVFILINTLYEIKKIKNKPISFLLKDTSKQMPSEKEAIFYQKKFHFSYIGNITAIVLSLLIAIISIFLTKENTIDPFENPLFYVNANETIDFTEKDDKVIIYNKIRTLDINSIKNIQNDEFVKMVEKKAFTEDLNVYNLETREKLDNVEISILDFYDWNIRDNIPYEFSELENEAIIYTNNPSFPETKNLYISRVTKNNKEFNWKVPVKKIFKSESDKTEIILNINSEKKYKNPLFLGYSEILITLKNEIPKENRLKIEDEIKGMANVIPGSLSQNVQLSFEEDDQIYFYIYALGLISFFVTVGLVALSIFSIIYEYYEKNKRRIGIYRSLGLTVDNIEKQFTKIIFKMYLICIVLAFLIYAAFYISVDSQYKFYYYLLYFIGIIFLESVILKLIIKVIHQKMKKTPISILLKYNE